LILIILLLKKPSGVKAARTWMAVLGTIHDSSPAKKFKYKNRCKKVDKRLITAKQEKEMLASFMKITI
jgi:hypothetical protein